MERQDALAKVETAASPEELQLLIGEVVRSYGFDGFTYHFYRPHFEELVYFGDWNPEWRQRYEEAGFADIDPVVAWTLRSITPFRWIDTVRDKPVNAPERQVLIEARAHGLVAGGEFPIHEHGLGIATLSVFCADEARFEAAWARHRDDMHLFSLYFHQRYAALLPHGEPDLPELTKREKECLSWTSRGKTAWEIGEILKISERTVRLHLDSAARKLGAFSKHQAVVKAIIHRIIVP